LAFAIGPSILGNWPRPTFAGILHRVTDRVDLADRLRALHVPGDPLLLLNAWDAASAGVVAAAGLPAVATTSSGVARALGFDDGERTPVDVMLAAVARIAAAVPDLPVTADVEGGYGLPGAELAARLVEAGAVGCNVEDTRRDGGDGPLRDAGEHAAYLASVKEAAPHLVVNARIDVHLRGVGAPGERLELALDRARRYVAAGADCVYPITLAGEAELADFAARAGVPVNALWTPTAPPPARLAELGVARVSVGGGLFGAAFRHTEALVARLKAGDPTALAED
jgi:2-methylisocitrate lyase-like PEP mutase family enzyme